MSRYYSFNDFMTDVINEADELALKRNDRHLEDLFRVSHSTTQAVISLIENGGWAVFIAVAALFAFGSFGIIGAIIAFLVTPVGLIVAAILGVSAAAVIRQMYKDRVLPNAVKSVGEEFKDRWENADGNRTTIDHLWRAAAESLYKKANDFWDHAL